MIHMFWSPNWAALPELTQWWPGADTVDIVGMDVYAYPGSTFTGVFDEFYGEFSRQYGKPMALGETSVKAGTARDRTNWVYALAHTDLTMYPCFKSVTWFEYLVGGEEFRIVLGQSPETVAETIKHFA